MAADSAAADSSEADGSDGSSPVGALPLHPPRRHTPGRRRVASLFFTDGSSCSCAPDCVRRSAAVDEPPAGAPHGQPDVHGCCAHMPDGREALCTVPEHANADAPRPDSGSGADGAKVGLAGNWAQGRHGRRASIPPALRPCPAPRLSALSSAAEGVAGEAPRPLLFVNRAPYPVTLAHVDQHGSRPPAPRASAAARSAPCKAVGRARGVGHPGPRAVRSPSHRCSPWRMRRCRGPTPLAEGGGARGDARASVARMARAHAWGRRSPRVSRVAGWRGQRCARDDPH